MNSHRIVFSPRAQQRLTEIADYLYQQQLSNQFVLEYLQRFEDWLITLLGQFPESGTLMPEFGDNVRRVVYQKYSFVYRINGDAVEILTPSIGKTDHEYSPITVAAMFLTVRSS